MFWFLGLPFEKPEDFWLNVLAGVPFLLFDILIITMLLPRTIEWWQERSWQRTRLTAIKQVLNSYRDLLLLKDFARVSDVVRGKTPAEARAAVRDHLLQFQERLHQGNRDLENELQTALPILGPNLTEELLKFHFTWKTYMTGARALADMLIHHADRHDRAPSDAMLEGSVQAHYMTAASLGLMFRRLRIRFAPIHSAARAAAEPAHMLADVPDLYVRAWWEALAAKSPDAEALARHWRDYAAEQLQANRALLSGSDETVIVYRYRGLMGRLSGQRRVPIYLSGDTTDPA